jgi:hypothetical protein
MVVIDLLAVHVFLMFRDRCVCDRCVAARASTISLSSDLRNGFPEHHDRFEVVEEREPAQRADAGVLGVAGEGVVGVYAQHLAATLAAGGGRNERASALGTAHALLALLERGAVQVSSDEVLEADELPLATDTDALRHGAPTSHYGAALSHARHDVSDLLAIRLS